MLVKLGVDISRLKRPCRRSLESVEFAYKKINDEAVISSTYEGDHCANSLHYDDNAYDILPPKKISGSIMRDSLKIMLGKDFDIIYHRRHIHIEYDPK